MRALKVHTSEETAAMPNQKWVRADSHAEEVRDLEHRMSLCFSPRDTLAIVKARDEAEKLVYIYEKALRMIALAAGRVFNGQQYIEVLEPMTAQITTDLAALRELRAKGLAKKKKR